MFVFVIMPFADDFTEVYKDIIKPPLEEMGCTVIRGDEFNQQRNVLKDIVEYLAQADLVIADLTGKNPNVFYELGLAHAFRKPTLMITQNLDELPFDVGTYRTEPYSHHHRDVNKLQSLLRDTVQLHHNGGLQPHNPVTDFLPDSAFSALGKPTESPSQEVANSQFSPEDFLERVTDPDFVQDEEYIKLLVDEIPKNENALVLLYRTYMIECRESQYSRNLNRYRPPEMGTRFGFIIRELLDQSTDDEKHNFFAEVSDTLKSETNDYMVRLHLQILSPKDWTRIRKVARLRIENKILESIKEGIDVDEPPYDSYGWLATWATSFLVHFNNISDIKYTLLSKLRNDNLVDRHYVMKHFLPFIYEYAESYEISAFVHAISRAIIKGDEITKRYLLDQTPLGQWEDKLIAAMKDEIPGIEFSFRPPRDMNDIPF